MINSLDKFPSNLYDHKTVLVIQAFEDELGEADPSLETNLDFGRTLIRSGKIVSKSSKSDIQKEIDVFLQRRTLLTEATAAEKNK